MEGTDKVVNLVRVSVRVRVWVKGRVMVMVSKHVNKSAKCPLKC